MPTGNLNEATLNYARARHNEWLDSNGKKWAQGLVLISVSPQHRLVGTYFGENVKVPQQKQSDIQQSAKTYFRAGDWSGGVIAAAKSSAHYVPGIYGPSDAYLVNPPVWCWGLSLLGAGNLIWGLWLCFSTRQNLRRAHECATVRLPTRLAIDHSRDLPASSARKPPKSGPTAGSMHALE